MFGRGLKQGIDLWVEDVSGAVGENIELVLKARHDIGLAAGQQISVDISLILNAFVLFPLNNLLAGEVSAGRRTIPMQLTIPAAAGEYEIARIPFTVMLGSERESALELTQPESAETVFDLSLKQGVFRLQDICEIGGDRLFNNMGPGLGIRSVAYDGQSQVLSLGLSFSGRDHADIKLYTAQGSCARTLYDAAMQPGDFELQTNVSDLGRGMYFLRMRVGSFHYSQGVILGD